MTTKPATTEPVPQTSSLHPWHFFLLLSMIAASGAVMLATDTHPVALLLLSAAVIAAGFIALGLHHALSGFFGGGGVIEAPMSGRAREDLEREKALVLRSIKELEFDRAMGKVGDRDFADISGRLRARALVLMEQLERQPAASDARAESSPRPASGPRCASCGQPNDADAKFCKHCGARVAAAVAIVLMLVGGASAAFAQQMPNPKEMSGIVLPVSDLPVGTITVRVIRGSLGNDVAGQPVEFLIDGEKRTVTTDASGRAEVAGLRPGARVRAVAVVNGERLESQEAVIAQSGLRVMLVATDPDAAKRAAEDKALAAAPPAKGMVVLGPETRVILEMSQDRLNVFYVLEVLNSARTPVDIGGPLIFDLPREARGASVLDGSTPQATANGPRVTITGPFAPGSTTAQVAYELPYSGATARLVQTWPAALQQTTVLVAQIGGLSIASPQITSKRDLTDQGQAVILGAGNGIGAGQSLELEVSGLPHHARWPRYLALSLAGLISTAGLWAAFTVRPARRRAA